MRQLKGAYVADETELLTDSGHVGRAVLFFALSHLLKET